jgi:uncharacterized membrane protein (UPF0127 family)
MPVTAGLLRRLRRVAMSALALAVIGGNTPAMAAGTVSLTVHTARGSHVFHVEIAANEAARAQGLMYRRSLAPDAGMLFVFEKSEPVSFWMKNTYIPLDMVFIRADGVVHRIEANAEPLSERPIPSGAPVRYVLEIVGGRAAEIGLERGDKVDIPPLK